MNLTNLNNVNFNSVITEVLLYSGQTWFTQTWVNGINLDNYLATLLHDRDDCQRHLYSVNCLDHYILFHKVLIGSASFIQLRLRPIVGTMNTVKEPWHLLAEVACRAMHCCMLMRELVMKEWVQRCGAPYRACACMPGHAGIFEFFKNLARHFRASGVANAHLILNNCASLSVTACHWVGIIIDDVNACGTPMVHTIMYMLSICCVKFPHRAQWQAEAGHHLCAIPLFWSTTDYVFCSTNLWATPFLVSLQPATFPSLLLFLFLQFPLMVSDNPHSRVTSRAIHGMGKRTPNSWTMSSRVHSVSMSDHSFHWVHRHDIVTTYEQTLRASGATHSVLMIIMACHCVS